MRTSTLKPDRSTVSPRAFIESAGIKHPTYTTHDFAGFKLEPDPDVGWLRPQWAINYKCRETGAVRKYGVVDATGISDDDRANEEPNRFGPGTAAEILKRAGLDGNRNLTRARVSELANGGRLVKLDERPCKVTGKQAIVWGAILRHEKPQPLPTMRVVKLTEDECQLAADVASGKRGTFSDEFTTLMNKLAAANDREAS